MSARTWRMIATLAALTGVIWLAGPTLLLERLATARLGWIALAGLLLVLQIWLSALRWQVTAQALGTRVPLGWAMAEYHLSVLGNTLLPGGVLGDLGRVARARGAMGGWRPAAASVVLERLAGQIALLLAGLAGLCWWLGARHGLPLGLAIGFGSAACSVMLVRFTPRRWRALAYRAWGAQLTAQVGLSAGVLACNLLGVWAAARAVGVVLDPADALFVIPLTLLAMLVPLTVNGWGVREGLAAGVWPLVGVTATEAVAASVAFGLSAMVAALSGLVPLVLRLMGVRRDRVQP